MRVSGFVVFTAAIAMTATLSSTARAQTTTAGGTTSTPVVAGESESHWVASAFVGGAWGDSADQTSVDYGGQIAWLWRGLIGPEFLADFSPDFKLNNILLSDNPKVNSYMFNAIGALPIGSQGQFQPYVSGGLGNFQMKADVLTINTINGVATLGTTQSDQSRLGSNFGGGLMGFAGKIGFRADIRRFSGSSNQTITTTNLADALTQGIIEDLSFWRANGGISFRW